MVGGVVWVQSVEVVCIFAACANVVRIQLRVLIRSYPFLLCVCGSQAEAPPYGRIGPSTASLGLVDTSVRRHFR